MGVPGLWKELAPAAKTRSLTELAVVEGFEANPNGSRGFRIGIDASIWFFHAAYGKEGENPELRTMFFRCATLTHAPFLPLFVFDGPKRPNVKRGKKINRSLHALTGGMKQIVESFGFEWRVAPGEAEAELAYLNRIGVLDGILSDDVDNFLFGATTVIRNPSNNLSGNRANPVLNSEGRDDKNHTRVYRLEDIIAHPDVAFTRGDMILIGLCSGGDYDTSGMTGCGPAIAKALVRYGFGRSLYEAAKNLSRADLPAFLHNWRNEIRHELLTDSKGYIGSKRRALAKSLPDAFPDIDILLSYVNPLTSGSAGRASDNLRLTWAKEPDLGLLAGTCEFYFEWGYRDAIIKRFKTVIWHGAVLRILRRGVLDMEDRRRRREIVVPSTPTKNGKPGAEGTPSKLITKHFSSLTLNPVADDEDDRLITRITRTRQHAYTDGMLEYRVEVRPRQLVLLAESGIKNIRRPLDADVWVGLTESGNEGGGGEKEKGELTPEERKALEEKEVLVWMPAVMVRLAEPSLVEEFERIEEAKRLKKAGKGTAKKGKTKAGLEEEEGSDPPPKTKPARKAKKAVVEEEEGSPMAKRKPKGKGKAPVLSDEEILDVPRTKSSKKPVKKAKKATVLEEEESGSDADALPRFKAPAERMLQAPAQKITKPKPKAFPVLAALDSDSDGSSDDRELPVFELPTNTKTPAVPAVKAGSASTSAHAPPRAIPAKAKGKEGTQRDLKTFFPLAKVIARAKTNALPLWAPLGPVPEPDFRAMDAGRSKAKATVSAPTPCQPLPKAKSGPSRPTLEREEVEESDDDVRRPATPSKVRRAPAKPKPAYVEISDAENENEATPPKMQRRPFPLSMDDSPRKKADSTRRKSAASSDEEARARLTKSPRKSAQHASPRERVLGPRAGSPTPYRGRADMSVIDISDSDSDDAPPPPPRVKDVPPPLPRAKTAARATVSKKAVLRPKLLNVGEVIDLCDF